MSKLTKKQWDKIKTEYVSTDISMTSLSKKYKVSRNTISKYLNSNNIKKIEQQIEQKVDEKFIDTIAAQRIKVTQDHLDMNNKLNDIVKILINDIANAKGLSEDKLLTAKLKDLSAVITNTQKNQRTALNMDEIKVEQVEPQITVIKGIDIDRI